MRGRAWLVYPLLAACATVAYYATGHISYVFNTIGASSPILILLAARRHPKGRRAAWYLFALGQALFISGDVVSYNYAELFGKPLPYPSIGDGLYLAVYPCLVAGLAVLIRARSAGKDDAAIIDSLMVGIGVGTLSWVFLIAPYLHDVSLPVGPRLVSIAYPLMDLMLITVAVRLALGAGRRPFAFFLIAASVVSLFATDAIYGWLLLHQGYTPGSGWLEIGWIGFYVLFGSAALHPSAHQLAERQILVRTDHSRWRPMVFSAVALAAPVTALVLTLEQHRLELPLLLCATIALFGLAVLRMFRLISEQTRAARRAEALRDASAALATATNREAIYAAATEVVTSLVPETDVAVVGSGATAGSTIAEALERLSDWERERLSKGRSLQTATFDTTLAAAAGIRERAYVFAAPLLVQQHLVAILVLGLSEPLAGSVAQDVESLAGQVGLALESAALTEDLYEQQSQARFTSLIQNSSDVFAILEADGTIRWVSPSASRVLGAGAGQLEGQKFQDLVPRDDRHVALALIEAESPTQTELRVQHQEGGTIFVEVVPTRLLHDENVRGVVLNLRDISERKAFEEQLTHQAFHDSLTGLANRGLFRDRVQHALERTRRGGGQVSVLFLDLDDFKAVNDTLGHAVGDGLLQQVADRLRNGLRESDTPARLGGDEFAILLEDEHDASDALDVAQRMLDLLSPSLTLEGKEVFCQASIGIATADGGQLTSADEVLRKADVAMYLAKEKGKARYEIFEPGMQEATLRRLELKAELQHGLDRGEFLLYYQPVIELATREIIGFEALVRWLHPTRGLVPPLEFIPVAEQTGLIVPLGNWVLREAASFAKQLQDESGRPLHVAVNLSARQLARADIALEVAEALQETGLPASSLILEITESVMMQDMDLSIARLTDLKQIGVSLAIDDFGTGYSSLNYVRRFPVDILKVDKSFIDGVTHKGQEAALTAAVVDLAHVLNLIPVAEGIEHPEQWQTLRELGCELGQGFLFAKPAPAEEMRQLLAGLGESDMGAPAPTFRG
jgi:diguanylate cyclase (GGDEF)-like protein/PAS domain S-box-containing protein